MLERLRAFVAPHQTRVLRLMVVALLLAVATTWLPNWPHATDLAFTLGPAHGEVVELRVAYMRGEEELAGVRFDFPEGAPATVAHEVKLPSGEVEVRCDLRKRSGAYQTVVRHVSTPTEGVTRLSLADDATWSAK